MRIEAFRVSRCRPRGRAGPDGPGWRQAYTQGGKLGTGATANVFEAETGSWAIFGCGRRAPTPIQCASEGFGVGSSRRVAIKRFKNSCDEAFGMELKALFKVGVHPNIVRLLEDYQGFGGENVLVYEYCDGLNLWELFLKEIKASRTMPNLFVGRVLQQLLLALEHINACGVEHRDVKPENIFLNRVSLPDQYVELKLGDFGWATIGATKDLPPQGAGSLWYAPPELNPTVDLPCDSASTTAPSTPTKDLVSSKDGGAGTLQKSGGINKDALREMNAELAREPPKEKNPFGKADMWSTGVILYLLLVGNNPFQSALQKEKPKLIEQEVLRLVARGIYDDTCQKFLDLTNDARDLICNTLQVTPQKRPTPTEALRHPFLMRCLARSGDKMNSEPAWRAAEREDAWGQLDGFQRLGWVSVARAVGEPELHSEVVSVTLRSVRAKSARGAAGAPHSAYLLQLAREISAMPMHNWLLDRGAWDELLRLAFSYLDVDDDNLLSAKDLASHISAPTAEVDKAVQSWIDRWESDSGALVRAPQKGLGLVSLRAALLDPFSTEGNPGAEDGLLHVACEGFGHAAGVFGILSSNPTQQNGPEKLL